MAVYLFKGRKSEGERAYFEFPDNYQKTRE